MDEPDDNDLNQATAKALIGILPEAVAADVLSASGQDWSILFDALQDFTQKALPDDPDDTRAIEKMLLQQAVVLQNLFGTYAKSAHRSRAVASQFQAYAEVALKAQNQCRRTLATLNAIRKPQRVQFVRQLNQAINQQVNNTGLAETQKIPQTESIKLLEDLPCERLDTRTQSTASGADLPVEALGTLHRSQDGSG